MMIIVISLVDYHVVCGIVPVESMPLFGDVFKSIHMIDLGEDSDAEVALSAEEFGHGDSDFEMEEESGSDWDGETTEKRGRAGARASARTPVSNVYSNNTGSFNENNSILT